MFEDYRRKRLAQIKSLEKRGRFGSLEPLAREDFVKEVTEGSKMNHDGIIEEEEDVGSDEDEQAAQASRFKGTGVVVFLYKDSYVCLSPRYRHLLPILCSLVSSGLILDVIEMRTALNR